MLRNSFFAIGMLSLISVIGSTGLASAGYGAIAFDQHNCAWGRSWNFATAQKAAAVALAECGRRGCKVIVRIGPRQCGSLSSTPNCRGWGAATRSTLAEAQNVGLQSCARANTGTLCTVKVGDCNQ